MFILKTSDLLLLSETGLSHFPLLLVKWQDAEVTTLLAPHHNSMVISSTLSHSMLYFSQHIVPRESYVPALVKRQGKIEMKFALQPSEEMCRWSDNFNFYNRWWKSPVGTGRTSFQLSEPILTEVHTSYLNIFPYFCSGLIYCSLESSFFHWHFILKL